MYCSSWQFQFHFISVLLTTSYDDDGECWWWAKRAVGRCERASKNRNSKKFQLFISNYISFSFCSVLFCSSHHNIFVHVHPVLAKMMNKHKSSIAFHFHPLYRIWLIHFSLIFLLFFISFFFALWFRFLLFFSSIVLFSGGETIN